MNGEVKFTTALNRLPDDPGRGELGHADVDGVGPLVVEHDDLPVGGHRHLLAVLGQGGRVLTPAGWQFSRNGISFKT